MVRPPSKLMRKTVVPFLRLPRDITVALYRAPRPLGKALMMAVGETTMRRLSQVIVGAMSYTSLRPSL